MPAEAASGTARSEMIGIRVTPEEKRKIKKLSEARGRPYSEILREMGVEEAIEEHDRSVAVLGSGTADDS